MTTLAEREDVMRGLLRAAGRLQGHMDTRPRRNPHPDDVRPPMSPRAAAVIDAARDLAWLTHGNTSKAIYVERRESFARLRGCLEEYDREQRERGDS